MKNTISFIKHFFHLPSFRLPLIVVVSLIISGMNFLYSDFSWLTIFKNFLFTFLLWQGSYAFSAICHPFNQDHLQPRVFIYIMFALAYSVMVTILVNVALWQINLPFKQYLGDFFISFGVTLFISLVYFSAEYFHLFRKSVEEKEALKRAHIENELKVLNHQINPHFLFNSLNTLMSIIPEDSELALDFTRRFSNVYRYVLQSKNKDLVSLAEEMQFVNSYIFLMKIRHGENLKTDIAIADNELLSQVPPLTIQMICENAIKHNTIADAHHLHIKMYAEENKIVIWNNKNLKLVKENGTGTGLENIEKRYKYLSGKGIKVIDKENYFEVQLPLLNVQSYEISNSRR